MLRDDDAKTYSNLGMTFQETGRLDEAIATLGRAIALGPDLAEAHNNLGTPYEDRPARRGDRRLPPRPGAQVESGRGLRATSSSRCIFIPISMPRQSSPSIATGHAEFATPLAAEIQPHTNDRFPDRKLRIGFVSPDFRGHPVGQLLLPLFSHHDRRADRSSSLFGRARA